MRVLHIGKFYPPFAGGMECFLRDLCVAQADSGAQVAAVVHHHERGAPTGDRMEDGVKVFAARIHGQLVYAPVSPSFPRLLGRSLRTFRPRVLHIHQPNLSALAVLFSARARRIPWVIQWQSDVVPSQIDRRLALAYRFYRPLEQRLLARSAAVLVSSAPYLEHSSALAAWRDRCHVVPLGLDPRRLTIPDDAALAWADGQWPGHGLRVLSVGRLTYYKGHDVLIRALAESPDARLVLVGKGHLERRLHEMVDSLRVGERARIMGFVPDDRLRALLATCDCLCLPSVERTEAFGLVLLEAMHYGKPLIASNIEGSGVGWIVQHERNGLKVPVGEPAALAGAMARLAGDRALARRLGEHGRRRFEREFHIHRVRASIDDLYARINGVEV